MPQRYTTGDARATDNGLVEVKLQGSHRPAIGWMSPDGARKLGRELEGAAQVAEQVTRDKRAEADKSEDRASG